MTKLYRAFEATVYSETHLYFHSRTNRDRYVKNNPRAIKDGTVIVTDEYLEYLEDENLIAD